MHVTAGDDAIVVSLSRSEIQLLSQLFDQLDDLVDGSIDDEQIARRLFPDGHRDDREAAVEFRELTEQSLREARRERYAQCRAELPAPETMPRLRRAPALTIADEDVDRWLMTLNDIRLILGTRLGITDDDGPPDTGRNVGMITLKMVYYLITQLQDEILQAVAG